MIDTDQLIDEIMETLRQDYTEGRIIEIGAFEMKKILGNNLSGKLILDRKQVDNMIEKYKPFIVSFEKIGNSLAGGIVEEFIKDLNSLLPNKVNDD